MGTETYKKNLQTIIQEKLPDCKLYLFGSRARNTHDTGADFDLAIDNNKKIALKTLCLIKEKIEESSIPVFVDIIDLNDCSEDFIEVIEKEWIQWNT
jgi:uncharacterized protein